MCINGEIRVVQPTVKILGIWASVRGAWQGGLEFLQLPCALAPMVLADPSRVRPGRLQGLEDQRLQGPWVGRGLNLGVLVAGWRGAVGAMRTPGPLSGCHQHGNPFPAVSGL